MFHDFIGSVDVFKSLNCILLNALVEAVEPQAFSPQDVIIEVEAVVRLYFDPRLCFCKWIEVVNGLNTYLCLIF